MDLKDLKVPHALEVPVVLVAEAERLLAYKMSPVFELGFLLKVMGYESCFSDQNHRKKNSF